MSSYSKTGRLTKEDQQFSFITAVDLELLDPDPPFWTKTSWIQLVYGIWVNLTIVNIGLCLEFSAVAIPQLKESAEMSMTKNEEALIASILTLSSPIGCIIAGILMDRCGRKSGLIWCHVPIAVGWFYSAFARSASDIIVGRVIAGVGVGMAMAAPRAYVTEITLPNMRGVIGALPNLANSVGITIQAILGSFLAWRFLCFLCGGYATVMLCVNNFLPDTPYFILLNSTASAAKMTLKRFRSSKFNLEGELQTLEEFKIQNDIRRYISYIVFLSFCETRRAMTKSSACKPFGIILFYITLMQFAGINVITTYGLDILEGAHSAIDAHLGNVMLAVTRIILGLVTSFLLFRVGRRPLAVISAVGVGGVGLSLGCYLMTQGGGISPLIMLIAFVGFAVPGYHTLPTLMMFELFPLQIRGILSGIVLSSANLLMAAVIQIYPTMRDSIGLANTFIVYGTISLFGAVVLFYILPETKYLTLQEIEEYFNHRRLTLVSERRLFSSQIRSQVYSAKDLKSESSYYKDRIKKKKRLRIVSSDDEEEPVKERRDSKNLDKNSSDMSSDDIVIVYDEDLVNQNKKNNEESNKKVTLSTSSNKNNNGDSDKKGSIDSDKKVDHDSKENADRDKIDKNEIEQDKMEKEYLSSEDKDKIAKDKSEKEMKSKENDRDKTKKENRKSKRKDKTTPDTTEKENEDDDKKDKKDGPGEADKPSTSRT